MRRLKVFKKLSIVLKPLLVLTLLAGVESVFAEESNCDPEATGNAQARMFAATKGISVSDDQSAASIISQVTDETLKNQIFQAYDQGANKCSTNISADGNSSTSCRAAEKEFNESMSEFINACAAVNQGNSAFACAQAAQKCQDIPELSYERSSSPSPTDIAGSFNAALTGQQAPATPRAVTPSVESATERFKYCPVYAAEDLENMGEAVQESQDRVDELTERINTIQTELTEIQTEQAAKMKEIKDQMTETKEKADDDAEEIRLQMQEFDENLITQVEKLQESITQQHQIIQQLGDAKVSAYNAFSEAQTRLNLQCHAAALQKVEQMRQAKQALIGQSLYSAGGFNNLMKNVGLSNIEAAEKLGKEYYDRCSNDRAYRANLAIAERARAQAESAADKAIAAARERINKIEDQIHRVQGELKVKGIDNFMRRLDRLNTRLTTRMTQLQEDMVIQAQSYQAKIANKQNSLMLAQRQLQEAQDYLRQRQEYHSLKMQNSGGMSVTQQQRADFFDKYGQFIAKAKQTVSSCGNGLGDDETRICNDALPYAQSFGESLEICRTDTPATDGNTPIGNGSSAGDHPF